MLSSVWLGFSEKNDILSILERYGASERLITDMNPISVIAGTQSRDYIIATGQTLSAAMNRPIIA